MMQHRTKRLISFTFKNMLLFIGYSVGFLLSIGTVILLVKAVAMIWGPPAGAITMGTILCLAVLGGISFMKAHEDLKLAELRENRVMDTLKKDDEWWSKSK
jgi:hypothetical protein